MAVVDLFDVLADDTRRDLLAVLRERAELTSSSDRNAMPGEASVGELVDRLGITQPTVSKHLKVLREHELVNVREDGQHRYYRLAPEPLDQVREWLDGVAPTRRRSLPAAAVSIPFVDLWPAGYQVGSAIGRARTSVAELLRLLK